MAVTIMRVTDRIKVVVGPITFHVSPLKKDQRQHIEEHSVRIAGGSIIDAAKSAFSILKYSLKSIDGVVDCDGVDYALAFDSDDKNSLTDDCVSEVLTLDGAQELTFALMNMLSHGKLSRESDTAKEMLSKVKITYPKKKKKQA